MVIKYVAYTWQGERREGVLEVDREEDARELLRQDQLIPYRLVQIRPRRSLVQLAPSLFQPKPQDVIEFTRAMAALLRSGIALRESMVTLRDQSGSLGLKEALRRIIQDIEGGDRFSDACSRHPGIFSAFYVRLLRVGEATGGLASVMERLTETLLKRKAMRDKVKSALTYPMISMVVAIVVAVILVTYSLPALLGLLTEYGGTLPRNTQMLISLADFFAVYRIQVFLGVGAVVGVLLLYLKTKRGTKLRDRVVLRIPVVGKVVMQSSLFSLTSTFSALLEAGIPTVEALRLSEDGLNNVILRERLERVIEEATAGARLGAAFKLHWPDPPLLSQGIITGETSGNLPETLQGLATYYEQESTRAISSATELIQPAVILLVSLLVGFVATAVISGIYSTLNSIE
jgi:type IV pilus assembly protein PilC